MKAIERGDIWVVDLGEVVGSEQSGKRPCVIVQNNIGNEKSATTIICPITTKNKKSYPMHVPTDELKLPSIIKCENIRVVDKTRLHYFVCRIDMSNIDKALAITLGL